MRLFGRYRQWLAETGLFDLNLVAHDWRPLADRPTYDFVVIDEVQDLTAVQLALVLACLKTPGQFLLCGDSNQIVHPNFFSLGGASRRLFWQGLAGEAAQRQQLQVLQANFRNTRAVTELANTAAEDQAGALRLDRPREQLPGAQHLGRAGRGDAGPGQGRGTARSWTPPPAPRRATR